MGKGNGGRKVLAQISPENDAYMRTMAKELGITITAYINILIAQDRGRNAEKYADILERQERKEESTEIL